MTLIATGGNLRNRSLLGLQAMSREEAEREALYQQMVQQKEAQAAQLAGTGAGLAGSYAVMNPEAVKGAATAVGQKLGLVQAAPAAQSAGGFFSTTGGGAALAQGANAGVAAGGAAAGGAAGGAAGAGAAGAGGAGAMGSLAGLASFAAPLAIGVGAFYLLNKLFD